MNRTIPAALLALTLALGTGCFFGEIYPDDPFGREFSLKDTQHRYTAMVRFGRFDKAAIYVQPDVREAFMAGAPDTRNLHFTDYELSPVDLDEDKDQATVEVVYTAYKDTTGLVFEIRETQWWVRNGITNSWGVVPNFDRLDIKNDKPDDPDGKGSDDGPDTTSVAVERNPR